MKDERFWAIVHVADGFGAAEHWILSDKKISSSEVDAIFLEGVCSVDLMKFGIPYGCHCNLVQGVVECHGTREAAKALLQKCNNGEDPLSALFETEEDDE